MKENDKKIDDVKKAKEIMGKIDPELLSAALEEMIIEADEAEKPDVEKVKKDLRAIYDSIPESKDRASIMSKAITELDADVVEKEVGAIKEKLKGFSKETLINAAKDYADVGDWCPKNLIARIPCKRFCLNRKIFGCDNPVCIGYNLCTEPLPNCGLIYNISECIRPLFGGCKLYEILCTKPLPNCGLEYTICRAQDIGVFTQDPDGEPAILIPFDREQFKTEIIQEMLQNPRLSRAMKKMLKEIKDEESK